MESKRVKQVMARSEEQREPARLLSGGLKVLEVALDAEAALSRDQPGLPVDRRWLRLGHHWLAVDYIVANLNIQNQY